MLEHNGMPVDYLGDGVYALYDYTGIWLHANHHATPTDRVYIEPQVLKNLNTFVERVKAMKPLKLDEKQGENNFTSLEKDVDI